MAKARKKAKAAKRPAKKAKKTKTAALKARPVKAKARKRMAKKKPAGVVARVIGAIKETASLRSKLEGHNTFED